MPLIYKSDTHWVQVKPLPGGVMDGAISVTKCSRCKLPSIVHQPYSGQHLCGRHLSDSVRRRTSRELRRQLILPKDARKEDGSPFVVLVAVSGGKDSAVLLTMINDIIGSPIKDEDKILIVDSRTESSENSYCNKKIWC